jgi:hypothetical protein
MTPIADGSTHEDSNAGLTRDGTAIATLAKETDMRVIDELMYADGSRRPNLVEISGPINRRGAWGRAKLYYTHIEKHHILDRLEAIDALNPWQSPWKERRRARERRLGALINRLSLEVSIYTN